MTEEPTRADRPQVKGDAMHEPDLERALESVSGLAAIAAEELAEAEAGLRRYLGDGHDAESVALMTAARDRAARDLALAEARRDDLADRIARRGEPA